MSGGNISFPTLIVEAGFGVNAGATGYLALDDTTRGLLDTGTLAPDDTWVDISSYVHEVEITRGARRVDAIGVKYEAGSATILLDNSDRRFDPTNTAGPYVSAGVSQVSPMRKIRIRATDPSTGTTYPLFTGFADEWPVDWQDPKLSWCRLRATDGIKVLANFVGSGGGSVGAGEDSGARTTRLLNTAGWPADARDIDIGDTTLQATTQTSNSWEELQLTTESELGEAYIDGDGKYVFRRRTAIQQDTRSATTQGVFGDAASESVYSAVVMTDAPVAFWKLNETSGTTATDSSGNGHNGTYTGSPTLNQSGPFNGIKAVDFDGVDDFVSVGDDAAFTTTNYTLELWANADTVSVDGNIPFAKRAAGTTGEWHIVYVNNGTAYGETLNTGGTDYLLAQGTCSAAAWHHIVYTLDGSSNIGSLYVDGALVATDTSTNGTRQGDTTASVTIGKQIHATSPNWFDGKICNVAYYSTVLSAARIYAHYQASLPFMFERVSFATDDEQVYNDVRITRSGGSVQTATDSTSQTQYLTRVFDRSGLLMQTDSDALTYAQAVLYVSKDAENRFDELELLLLDESNGSYAQQLSRELGDRITVIKTPPDTSGTGSPSPIERDAFIRGITHRITNGVEWRTTWTLQSATKFSFLTLDNVNLGTLDSNALGY